MSRPDACCRVLNDLLCRRSYSIDIGCSAGIQKLPEGVVLCASSRQGLAAAGILVCTLHLSQLLCRLHVQIDMSSCLHDTSTSLQSQDCVRLLDQAVGLYTDLQTSCSRSKSAKSEHETYWFLQGLRACWSNSCHL